MTEHKASQSADETNAEETESKSAVGALLKAARVRVGADLRDVSEHLRIRYPYLVAIENGEFDALPGATYAVGFVRGYAEHLGLDGEEVVRRFKEEVSGKPSKADLDFPTPVSEGRIPSAALILVGVLLAGLAYGGWYWFSTADRTVADLVTAVPDQLKDDAPDETAPAETAPGETASTETTPTEMAGAPDTAPSSDAASEDATMPPEDVETAPAAPEPVQAAEPTPAEEPVAAEPTPAAPEPAQEQAASEQTAPPAAESQPAETAVDPAPTVEPVVEAPAAPPGPRVYGEENTDARIVMTAETESWVEVKKGEEVVLTRLMKAGDSFRVPNADGLTMDTGNAGGLAFTRDGKAVAPVGKSGEIKRSFPLSVATWAADGSLAPPPQVESAPVAPAETAPEPASEQASEPAPDTAPDATPETAN